LGGPLQDRGREQSIVTLPPAEQLLSRSDPVLGQIIASQPARWPVKPTEDPVWGLVRIIMAQQISTRVACRLAERVKAAYPMLMTGSSAAMPDWNELRALGLPERRAQCCSNILQDADELRAKVQRGQPWQDALVGIKGIGPWTLSVFRIMVLRDPDVLPLGDVGLERAIAKLYGKAARAEQLGDKWRPFRSVACWYLWRTLGNEQLG
jgi:DNA-3-methyladenine glycosylase II